MHDKIKTKERLRTMKKFKERIAEFKTRRAHLSRLNNLGSNGPHKITINRVSPRVKLEVRIVRPLKIEVRKLRRRKKLKVNFNSLAS